jgi:hypothetical protein
MTVMKRTALALFLISIFVIAGATWVILRLTENQIENQPYDVKIADFKWTSSWGFGAVGVLWSRSFNITLQNRGNRDAEGLSVDIKLLANNTEISAMTGLYGPGIIGYTAEYNGFDGKLNASETRELRGDFTTGLDKLEQARDWGEKTFTVRVMMNDTILDELLLPYT